MKKVVKGIVYAVGVLFIAWFVLSWADIVADNTEPNPQHSEYNMFVIMTREPSKRRKNRSECAAIRLKARTELLSARYMKSPRTA